MTILSNALRLTAFAAAGLSLGAAHAHHSYASFDRCTATTLDGEIVNIEWVNPHVVINVRTRDVDDYRVEWLSLIQLSGPRGNVPTEELGVGDRVRVVGHALKDPKLKVLSLVSRIERPSDGWSWQDPRPPASCGAG